MVVHIGLGPNRGHYVAVVKSGGRWLLFDDDVVELVNEQVCESVLFVVFCFDKKDHRIQKTVYWGCSVPLAGIVQLRHRKDLLHRQRSLVKAPLLLCRNLVTNPTAPKANYSGWLSPVNGLEFTFFWRTECRPIYTLIRPGR